MAILVDSSVWIAALNSHNKESLELKRLMKGKKTIVCAKPIQVEVCQGAKSEADFYRLWQDFLGFQFLTTDDNIWDKAAYLFFRLRKKGITASTVDCVIASLANENGVQLWSLDKIFKKISSVSGFDLYVP